MNHVRRIFMIVCGALSLMAAPASRATIHGPFEVSAQAATGGASTRITLPEILGSSGKLRALIGMSDSLARDPALQPLFSGVPLSVPGIHSLGLTAPDMEPVVVVFLEPLAELKAAPFDAYRVGRWPTFGLVGHVPRYAPPQGFISVTPENKSTQLSKRFRLGDFLTHDQQNVWPKVLVLRVALLDKLELISDELERRGLPSVLHIMSGFRTPQYNAQGVGAKGGRASGSRHMYGDAADVFVDANGDGVMDDLDGDGRITIRDARVLYGVAEDVEAEHASLVGGLSAYPANSAHGPFVHVDARGVRARW